MEMQYKDAAFVKVLEEPVNSTLLFPDDFVSKYGEMLPQMAFLMTTGQKYGRCWKVKVARLYSGRVCFAQGWPHFVDQNPQIRASDLAVFRLVDASTFHVTVFGSDGLQKPASSLMSQRLPSSPPPPPQAAVVENNTRSSGPSRNNKRGVEVGGVKSFTTAALAQHHFYRLTISTCFAEETGIASKCSIRLKFEDGVESWQVLVRVREDDGRIYLAGLEWKDFWIKNGLSIGNTLTFSMDVEDDPGTLHVSREGFVLPTPPQKPRGRPRKS